MSDSDDKGGRGRGKGFGKRPDGAKGPPRGGFNGGPRGERPKADRPARAAGSGEGGEKRSTRPRGDKPFRPREDRAASGERAERPRFQKREDGERPARAFKPRAPRDGGEGEERPRFRKSEGAERPRFQKREDGERPVRAFKPRAPREGGEGEERPRFAKSEGGERTRFQKREDGEHPARAYDRTPRRGDGEGRERKPFKPFVKRGEGSEEGGERRFEKKAFVPRSRGMMSHAGAPDEAGERPRRSVGKREHGDVQRERPARSPRPARQEEHAGVDTMRIAKRLARAGIASRREAESMIVDGRVSVNGKVLESPALDVSASDRIEIDGKPIPAIERTRLWLFHKPAGTVTTNHDPEGRPTVFDRLPEDMPRVLSVGRLDINTEGLLLLTNDGGLARMLELPATGWLRRYRVRAHGEIDQARLDELRQGIAIDGIFYGAIEATLDRTQGSNVWLTLGLREGKNREVKRVLGHLGLDVNRLIRLSFGPFQLADLEEGAVREIKGRTLREQLGERLIEESGADFEAPVVKAFSNKVVKADEHEERSDRPRKRGDWISASDAAPNKKRFGQEKRASALDRLDTRPDRGERAERKSFGEKAFGGEKKAFGGEKKSFGDKKLFGKVREDGEARPKRPAAAAPRRHANVWMAPGARPRGKSAEGDGAATLRPRGKGPSGTGPKRPSGPKRG